MSIALVEKYLTLWFGVFLLKIICHHKRLIYNRHPNSQK